jgi:hypothetical protein
MATQPSNSSIDIEDSSDIAKLRTQEEALFKLLEGDFTVEDWNKLPEHIHFAVVGLALRAIGSSARFLAMLHNLGVVIDERFDEVTALTADYINKMNVTVSAAKQAFKVPDSVGSPLPVSKGGTQ